MRKLGLVSAASLGVASICLAGPHHRSPQSDSTVQALRLQIARSARSSSGDDHIARADQLEKLHLYHLALAERLMAARAGRKSSQDLARIGDLSLALGRLDPIGILARTMNGGEAPASFRAAV